MDENENPYETIIGRADEMGLEGDERDDYIEARMRRAGYKRGPGEWVSLEDDSDDPRDDDDEPMTRGDWRRMQRERKRSQTSQRATTPPKREAKEEKLEEKPRKRDAWWG